jgi:hypothetical protein
LNNAEPEPNGQEGLADVRIVQALLASMRSGQPVKLEPFEKRSRPGEHQNKENPAIKPRPLVDAQSASGR